MNEPQAADDAPPDRHGVPCICPRQFEADPPVGIPVSSSDSREITVERLRCTGCTRTWTRVSP